MKMSFSWFFWPIRRRRSSDQAETGDQTQINESKKEKKKWSKKIWTNIFKMKSKKDGEGKQEGAGEGKVPQKSEGDGTGVEPANAENISGGTMENWMLDKPEMMINQHQNGENIVSRRRFSDQAELEDQTQADERKKGKKKRSKKKRKKDFRKKSKKDGKRNQQKGAGEGKVPQKPEKDGTGVEPANAENDFAGTMKNWMLDKPEMMINQHQNGENVVSRGRFSDQAELDDQTQVDEHKKEKKKRSKKKRKKDGKGNLQKGAREGKVHQKPEKDGTGVEPAKAENISAGTIENIQEPKNFLLYETEMMINQHQRKNEMLHEVDAGAEAEVMNVQTENIIQDAENEIIIKAERDQAELKNQTQVDEHKKEKKKWIKKIWKNIFRKKSKKDGEGNLQKIPQKPEEDGTGVEPANAKNISAGTMEDIQERKNILLDETEIMINQHQRENEMLHEVDAEAEAGALTKVMNMQTENIIQDAENAENGENVISHRRFSDQAEPEDQAQVDEHKKEKKKRSKKKRKNGFRKKSKKDGEGKPEEDGTGVEPANAENISAGTIEDIQEPKNFLLVETEMMFNQHQKNEMLHKAEAEAPTTVMNVQTEDITQDAKDKINTKAEHGENVMSRDDPGSYTDDGFTEVKKTRKRTRGRGRKMNYQNNNGNKDEVENEIPDGANTGAEAEARKEMTEVEPIFKRIQIIDEDEIENLIKVMKDLLDQQIISRQILAQQIADLESSNKRNNAGRVMSEDNLDGENVISQADPANEESKKKTRKGRRGRKCNNKKNNTEGFEDQTNASEATATPLKRPT